MSACSVVAGETQQRGSFGLDRFLERHGIRTVRAFGIPRRDSPRAPGGDPREQCGRTQRRRRGAGRERAPAPIDRRASAEDVEKKFRLGVSVGGFDGTRRRPQRRPRTSGRSSTRRRASIGLIQDPRNDSGAIGRLRDRVRDSSARSPASYAFTPAIGTSRGRSGTRGRRRRTSRSRRSSTSVTLDEARRSSHFRIFNLNGGTLTQIPLQLTAGVRFRPKATLNPYVVRRRRLHASIGFEPSDELNELSTGDRTTSTGGFARHRTAVAASTPPDRRLASCPGITVGCAGRRRVAPRRAASSTRSSSSGSSFVDVRYTSSTAAVRASTCNGDRTELGISVPGGRRSNIADSGRLRPVRPVPDRDAVDCSTAAASFPIVGRLRPTRIARVDADRVHVRRSARRGARSRRTTTCTRGRSGTTACPSRSGSSSPSEPAPRRPAADAAPRRAERHPLC